MQYFYSDPEIAPKMKRFLLRFTLFLMPFILVSISSAFLPFDFFTPRVWEGVLVRRLLPDRPFYPNLVVVKEDEEGALGKHSPLAIKRRVVWETDAYGYRNSSDPEARQNVVIIGDSFTVGTGLSQEETLAPILAEKLGMSVYSFAPGDINSYIRDKRFKDSGTPDIVVLAKLAEQMRTLPAISKNGGGTFKNQIHAAQTRLPELATASIYLDQIVKTPWLFAARAWADRTIGNLLRGSAYPPGVIASADGSQLLYESSVLEVINDADLPYVDEIVGTLKSYQEHFAAQGVRFIFIPIPSPTEIHYDELPPEYKTGRPKFFNSLIAKTEEAKIATLNLFPVFVAADRSGISVFQNDDDHWSAPAVKLAAKHIAPRLRSLYNEKKSAMNVAH